MTTTSLRGDRAFFGHPAGLGWLAFCELWERFSYYGMQGLLGLYAVNYLFMPEHIVNVSGMDSLRGAIEYFLGPRSVQQLGSMIFGIYAAFVYLTPIFGGLIADRWLGRTKTVTIGALLMALGHFLMAFDVAFLWALVCLVVGVGCFKGNIAAQVGDLYAPEDKRRSRAFQIFMLAVQIAVIAAPLVCGTLGEKVGWHWGFGSAGVGMLIGLVVYLTARPWLPPEAPRGKQARAARARLSSVEKKRLALLVAILPVLMLSIVGNQQFQNAFPLWSQKHMDLVLLGWQVPVTWLQAVDAAISTVTMIGVIAFWRWWALHRREPSDLVKMAIGCLIAALAPAALILASQIASTGVKVSFIWTVIYSLINDIGFANILPVGLALYSRAAPRNMAGMVVGTYYLHLFAGNFFVGWLAGFLETLPGQSFWAMHALLVGAAGVLLLVVRALFGRVLEAEEEPAAAAVAQPA
ncbi:MAG TPA: peptide MFS transporter [Burkholderiaceae bacterium]